MCGRGGGWLSHGCGFACCTNKTLLLFYKVYKKNTHTHCRVLLWMVAAPHCTQLFVTLHIITICRCFKGSSSQKAQRSNPGVLEGCRGSSSYCLTLSFLIFWPSLRWWVGGQQSHFPPVTEQIQLCSYPAASWHFISVYSLTDGRCSYSRAVDNLLFNLYCHCCFYLFIF